MMLALTTQGRSLASRSQTLCFPCSGCSSYSCIVRLSPEVYTLLKEVDDKGVALREPAYLTAIRTLLAKGCLTEALEVRDM